MVYVIVFFFKQKTAYEMRISDWSSDVCSSDLDAVPGEAQGRLHREARVLARLLERDPRAGARVLRRLHRVLVGPVGQRHARAEGQGVHLHRLRHRRSEEHTSELQSLMRISYAVFCLKNKKQLIYTTHILDRSKI